MITLRLLFYLIPLRFRMMAEKSRMRNSERNMSQNKSHENEYKQIKTKTNITK